MEKYYFLNLMTIVFIFNIQEDECARYNGYKVFRAFPKEAKHLAILTQLEKTIQNLDFWTEPRNVNRTVDVMIPPGQFTQTVNSLNENGIDFDVMIEDIQSLIDQEEVEDESSPRSAKPTPTTRLTSLFGTMTWNKYHRLSVIYNYMNTLALKYPNLVQVSEIGRTFERRPMKLIKIGAPSINKKPAIWIDAGIHAREWIAPATATCFIEQLILGYSNNDSVIQRYVNDLDWYILPVLNPDGYEYSHTLVRMWRKNRAVTKSLFCRGVDLNRNFGFHWNEAGSSNQPCAEHYAGPTPFSEPETKSVSQFINSHDNIRAFLTLHSYGQYWMTPWGYTSQLPADYQDLMAVATEAAKAIKSVYGTEYTLGSSTNVLYSASGGSDDWAKGAAHIKYSYTIELRDKGRYGFLLPSNQILATCRETWAGISAVANRLLS